MAISKEELENARKWQKALKDAIDKELGGYVKYEAYIKRKLHLLNSLLMKLLIFHLIQAKTYHEYYRNIMNYVFSTQI